MWKLVFAGLALSAASIVASQPAASQSSHRWCTNEGLNSLECYWDTKEQCAMNKQHLMGGTCFENPFYQGVTSTTADRADPAKKKRRDAADH